GRPFEPLRTDAQGDARADARAPHHLASSRKSLALQRLKGRHLGFAPDEAHRRGGVPFLEKWGGSLAVQPRWQRRTNVWRKVTSPARGPMRLRSGTARTGIDEKKPK